MVDANDKAGAYAKRKQTELEALIRNGAVAAYPDALRFVEALLSSGLKLAAASSSKNANQLMRSVRLPSGRLLLDAIDVNLCGRDVKHGKPAPELFLLAAAELNVPPGECLVVEDAPAGIAAALAGGMTALGVARLGDSTALQDAGADLVVESLDEVAVQQLAEGRLRRQTL